MMMMMNTASAVFVVLAATAPSITFGFAPKQQQQQQQQQLYQKQLQQVQQQQWGVVATIPSSTTTFTTTTQLFAGTSTGSTTVVDETDFEGVELKALFGVAKLKKRARKTKRINNQLRRAATASGDETMESSTAAGASASTAAAAAASASDPLKLIIAGAPASGKGTQCALIKDLYGVVHLSTGDMLRAAVADQTQVGLKAKEYMDSGKLVPDEVIIGVVKDRLDQDDCKTRGWLLDGFPRTPGQAEALAAADIAADCFIFLNVPDDMLVERVVGRRTDPETGDIYHMTFNPPPSDAPEILARLEQRSDDTEEKVKVRLEQFHANVDAVKGFYTDISVAIDGADSPDKVSAAIQEGIAKKVPNKKVEK